MGIVNCYTLECSFCGADFGKYQDLHFNTDMLQSIGPKFCESIMEFHQVDPLRLKVINEEIAKIATNEAAIPNDLEKLGFNLDDEANTAAAGLIGAGMSKDVVLGIIKDEGSCQDSDFSGDDDKFVPNHVAQNKNDDKTA